MKKFVKNTAVLLLMIICTVCLACGLSACKPKKTPIGIPENATTYRLKTPDDGSLPTAHTPLENIGYLAYTLDNQPYYHSYARNSSKAMGYEQITQSWKDHKGEKESGYAGGATVSSDLSYSALSKAATQGCFIGSNDGYMRGGSKPGKNTTPTTEEWNTGAPTYYDKKAYLYKYGEFPNEISVYVINEDTIKSADEVVDNGDGTYSQKFYLSAEAACWYQYGLKTRGSLKGYPKYSSIVITFTFDSQWQLLQSYCEEKTKIAPGALGGIDTESTSKTTSTYTYGAEAIDNEHYAYLENYFKAHLDNKVIGGNGETEIKNPEITDILGGGFNKVLTEQGQQFDLDINLGGTEYEGKVFARLTNMKDVLGTLDVRAALGKEGTGKQDLYIGFANGDVDVYYSTDFAATVNINGLGTVINQFKDWAKRFEKPSASPAAYAPAEEEGNDPLAGLLASLKMDIADTSAVISLVTDDLLGTGIGADVKLNFSRTKADDGDTFAFTGATLSGITYSKTGINLSGALAPDNSGAATITRDKTTAAVNLAECATSVYNMLNSNTVKVSLGIDGTKEGVISMLSGVKLNLDSYVALGSDMAAKADLSLALGEVSAKLSAYYNVNIHSGDYGTVYLTLEKVNGKEVGARVRCNINSTIDAVKQLVSVINNSNNAGETTTVSALAEAGQTENQLATIINKALALDFSKVFGEIYAKNSEIRLAVNLDEILGGLGVNFADMKFGSAALSLGKDTAERATLSLGLDALGFNMSVTGSDSSLTVPDESKYTDVNVFINLVKAAAEEVNKIIAAKDAAFEIDSRVTADGVTLAVKGKGEAVWGAKTRVALDLDMYVADGTSASAKDTVAVKLVYDEAASDGTETAEEPLVLLSVNDLGLKIYRSDVNGLKDTIKQITDALQPLIGGNKQTETTAKSAVQLYNTSLNLDAVSEITSAIESVLQSDKVQTVLKAVLNFVGDLTVNLTYADGGEELQSFLITHAVNGSLALGVDDNLWMDFTANNNDGTEIAYVNAKVSCGNGSLSAVDFTYNGADIVFSSTDVAGDAFTKIIYNYLFAVVEDLTVQNVLGADTYTVSVALDGSASSIPALEGVKVNASLYYTHGIKDGSLTKNKLVEADVDLDINGLPVKANVRYSDEYVFIALEKIANITFQNIKVRANVYDIYSVAEQVVNLITDTDLLSLFTGKDNGNDAPVQAVKAATKTSVTNVLSSILTMDFSAAVKFSKVDGVNTVTVNPDYVLEKIGVNVPEIGVITAGVNPKTHAVTANAKVTGATDNWLTLSALPAERRAYADNWTNGYTDISFMSQLVSDVVKTAFTDGKLNTLYTFTGGSINIDIKYSVISVSIEIKNIQLTAGLDENDEIFLSVKGDLQSSSFALWEVSKQMGISVTYSGGYITLGRNLDTTPIYKVMTLEYLLDNMLDKENSPIRWLLGTSGSAWNLIADNVKINIETGLTKPKDYYLYDQLAKAKNEKDILVNLASYIRAIAVNSGSYTANFTDEGYSSEVLTNLSLGGANNYYAFDVNPEFTGILKALDVAIMRDNANGGLTGLKAFASIDGKLLIKVDLNGLTSDKSAAVPNYFKSVVTENNVDFNHTFTETQEHRKPIFGCYNSEDNTYICSMALEPHTLTVINGGETVYVLEEIGYGSTVHLTNVFAPRWTDESKTAIYGYKDGNGDILASSLLIESDVTVYVATVNAYPVNFHIDRNELGTIEGAVTLGEALPEYPSDFGEYTFVGWYTDTTYTTKVTNHYAGLTDVYASYVIGEYVDTNGIKYVLDPAGFYTVTSFDPETIKNYNGDDSWLILKNTIDGYPVTGIASNALASAGVKNVLVPANITSIGSRAFLDNYGIKNVVFAADEVHLQGTSKDTVFYGCSDGDGGTTTSLNVYYNAITADAGNDWSFFRDSGKGCYIGRSNGGSVVGGGNWSYTQFVVDCGTGVELDDSNFGFNTDGIKTVGMTVEQMTAQISDVLNSRTCADGVINVYSVTVTNGYTNNGKINTVTIYLQVNEAPDYLVTVNADRAGTIIDGDTTVYNDGIYAKAGTVVTLLPPDGFVFGSVTASALTLTEGADGEYTFTMPERKVILTATTEKASITKVTLNSAVAFSYGGTNYAADEQAVIENVVEGETVLETPVAQGYVFLGWAYNNGTSLEFVSPTVNNSTYYAVWGVARDEISSVTALTSGADPNAASVTVDSSKASSFYKWYADAAFANEVNAITLSDTVLYGRVNYTLTVNGETNVSGFGTSSEITLNGSKQSSYTTEVLEGEVIYLKDMEGGNNKVYNIMKESDGVNALVGEIRIKTKNSLTGSNSSRELTVTCTDTSWSTVADHLKVIGNVTFKFAYYK